VIVVVPRVVVPSTRKSPRDSVGPDKVVEAISVDEEVLKIFAKKFVVVAFVPVAFMKFKFTTESTAAQRFERTFRNPIDEDAIVAVAIVVVPFKIAPEPVIVTTFVDDANNCTISPTAVVVA
jgi:hypothetical protein